MLQRTENSETSSIETSSLSLTTTETIESALESEVSARDLDAELKELATAMQAGVAQRERTRKSFLKVGLSALTAIMLASILWIFLILHNMMVAHTMPQLLLSFLMPFSTPVILIGGLWWANRDRCTTQERNAAQRLLEIDDVRVVGLLIDTLAWRHKGGLRPRLWQALGRLLPRLSEDEAQALGKDRHLMLATWVQAWDVPVNRKVFAEAETQTLTAMLHTMAQVGQSSFQYHQTPIPVNVHLLPTLKKWAEGKGSGQDPEVQQSAIACREEIEQRKALARTSAQLLRASSPVPTGRESLLRPAQGTTPTDPQELLRPGDPNT